MEPSPSRLLGVCFLLLALSPTTFAATWYVNGVSGSDSNNCLSATTPCKTIGHVISLAVGGDTVRVGPSTYTENLAISINLKLIGAGAATTMIDGGGANVVITVSNANAHVNISNVTVRNGSGHPGGGIYNNGILTVNRCMVSGNTARGTASGGLGGGIHNGGTLTVNNSTIAGNQVSGVFGAGFGGGIGNSGTMTVNNSTIGGNTSSGWGGGIGNLDGNVSINNATVAGNKEIYSNGGIANYSGTITLQNSITANNAGDCYTRTAITSKGYNLSSDGTCNFNGPGDLNNTDPMLGPLQNNGGPTLTIALPSGSPPVDAGNPSGCTDGAGHLLKTDQRGRPRPDKPEDTGGCDIGAYERQSD